MGRVIELFVDQFLAIDQDTPASNPQGQSVSQPFVLTDFAKNFLTVIEVSQTLQFGEAVSPRRSVYNLSVSDYLPFYQSGANGPQWQQLVQFFFIGQSVTLGEYEIVTQVLTITQSVTVSLAKAATDTLVMTDVATCNVYRGITVTQTLFVGSGGTGYIFREDTYSVTLPTITGPNVPEC
jgi:hypothetical protein